MTGAVLVAFGTGHDSTRGIAAAVAQVLRAAGIPVELTSMDAVRDLEHARAAVLGSVVYDGGWLPGAHDFLATHQQSLAAIPTWLFASGPLDPVPPGATADLPGALVEVIGRIGPRDVALFTGSNQPHHMASGLRLLSTVARRNIGDHRDWVAIERWASSIRDTLLAEQAPVAGTSWGPAGES